MSIFKTSSPLVATVSAIASVSINAPHATICPAAILIVDPDFVMAQPSRIPSDIARLIRRIKLTLDIGPPSLVINSGILR